MKPFFADGIDLPILLVSGIIVLVPLLAFEVFVEAFVLKKVRRLPYQGLCKLTFIANCLSLLAGVPTKILNSYLSWLLLPDDLPGFFARYPMIAALGSLNYFAITVLVEGGYAFRWLKREGLTLSARQIWRGMLLANLATYAVLAPVNYFATRPLAHGWTFSRDTQWSRSANQSNAPILFIGNPDRYLKTISVDGHGMRTLVPIPVEDYLISADFTTCLFRGTNGSLYLYQRGKTNLIWKTDGHFSMNQAAFSPSGSYVAFASEKDLTVELVDVAGGKRTRLLPDPNLKPDSSSVAWSPEEGKFFVATSNVRLAVEIGTNSEPAVTPLQGNTMPPVLKCYGRVGTTMRGGSLWGDYYDSDTCGDLKVRSEAGLGSALIIERGTNAPMFVAVDIGLLHIAGFWFGDVEFLPDCDECLFEAENYIYLLQVSERRVGTLVKGERFIQLTARYEKTF